MGLCLFNIFDISSPVEHFYAPLTLIYFMMASLFFKTCSLIKIELIDLTILSIIYINQCKY